MLRGTLAASIALGLIAGALIAIVVPQTRPAASVAAAPATTFGDAAPSSATVRRVAPPRPKPKGLGYVRLRAIGPIVIEARVADPHKRPDWAVRSFLAQRLAQDAPSGSSHVIGRNRCYQLGRLYAGRFGWLTSDGTFRRALVDLNGVPTRCVSRRPQLGASAFAELRSTITDPDRPAAKILAAVVWGAVGAAGQPAVLRDSRPVKLTAGPHGGFLASLPADTQRADLTATVTVDGRPPQGLLPGDGPPPGPPGVPGGSGKPILAAEAPDPDGGLPYALIVTKDASGVCTRTGPRVVDGRAGSVDYALDTFTEDNAGGGGCSAPPGSGGRTRDGRTLPPWTFNMSSGAAVHEPGSDPASGRVARRTLTGSVIVAGTAQPDVASLTIASPTDVRTLVPTGAAHGFITIYAGTFPTGNFSVTTTLKNGRTRHDTVPAGI